MSAPEAAANAEGNCGRLLLGTASSVSDDRPASSAATGLDASSREKSARFGNLASTPVTLTAGAGAAAAENSTAARRTRRETGGICLRISPPLEAGAAAHSSGRGSE
jgi:hypothetical protein